MEKPMQKKPPQCQNHLHGDDEEAVNDTKDTDVSQMMLENVGKRLLEKEVIQMFK